MKTKCMDRIVTVAGALFKERGYSAVHMDDIARELGVSKKTLYQCVPSKEELLRVMCEGLHAEFKRHSREVLNSRTLTLKEKLSRHMEFCHAKLGRLHPSFDLDVRRHAPLVYERMTELRHAGTTNTISALLEQGRREGVVRKDLSTKLIIEAFRAAVMNLMQSEVLEAMDLTAARASREIMELFFSGILIREPKVKK